VSLDLLVQGVLVGNPISRIGKSGKPFVTAMLRVPITDGDVEFFSIIGFSESSVEALMARSAGDSLAITGQAQRNTYTDKNGTERRGWKIVVERVLSLYQARKARKEAGTESTEDPARAPAAAAKHPPYERSGTIESMSDDIPF
jgi:single-stranded DNA-binding protein